MRSRRPIASAAACRFGSVAILTAVCAPVLLLIVGFAVDYGYASYINQRLAKAADSAVLTAVSQTAATAGGGYGNTSFLQSRGDGMFRENMRQLSLSGVNFSLNVQPDGSGGVTATGVYAYASPTFFSGILGKPSIHLSGSVSSTAHPITYVNYYILVDTSQSMGIAATQADMNALYQRVVDNNNGSDGQKGCVFGCHVKAPGQSLTNEGLAHNSPRITLRIDAAVAAIQQIITAAANTVGANTNIQFALYTIQANPNDATFIQPISDLSYDYATLINLAAKIELGDNVTGGFGDSDFPKELSAFDTTLSANASANGSGASATKPLNYVFIITDGATDIRGNCNPYGHCTSAFDPNNCAEIKKKATVGVIYTTYLPIWNENDPSSKKYVDSYRDLVLPFTNYINPNLQSCATSSDYFFEAIDGPAISSAMQALFLKTLPKTARLTL